MKLVPKPTGWFAGQILLMVAAMATSGVAAGEYVRGQPIPELRLRNGTVLRGVSVVAVGSSTIVAKWDGGRGTILLNQLPDDLRTVLAPSQPVTPAPAPAAVVVGEVLPPTASVELPTEIKLTNGFVMHKSTVTRWDSSAVLVSYQGGIVSVRFVNIVPEQRAIFEARKDEALARQAKEDATIVRGDENAAREDKLRQATEARTREDADQKADEINRGISSRYLVKGMTKQQVKLAFGSPVDDKAEFFVYPSRGHDKYGNSADRVLLFRDGLLAGWRDMREGEPAGAVEH